MQVKLESKLCEQLMFPLDNFSWDMLGWSFGHGLFYDVDNRLRGLIWLQLGDRVWENIRFELKEVED